MRGLFVLSSCEVLGGACEADCNKQSAFLLSNHTLLTIKIIKVMRKLLFLLLTTFSVTLWSQISVNKLAEPQTLVTAMGFSTSCHVMVFNYEDGTESYYLVTSTTNRFDDRFMMSLGHNRDEVKQSLKALIDMTSSKKGAAFSINEDFTASVVAKNNLGISGKNYAGAAFFSLKQLQKLLNYFE